MITILNTSINESDSIVDTKNSFNSMKDLVAAASKGSKSKSVNLDKISKDLKNLVNKNMDESEDTLNEGDAKVATWKNVKGSRVGLNEEGKPIVGNSKVKKLLEEDNKDSTSKKS